MRISQYDTARLVNKAFIKVCRIDVARNGLSWKGKFPLNRICFNNIDFLPVKVTEISKP